MKTLSLFVVLLALLVSFCDAAPKDFGGNKELLRYPINAEATWKKFMGRLLKNIRTTREAAKRELNLPQEPSVAIDEKQEVGVGVVDKPKTSSTVVSNQSCGSYYGCSITAATETTVHASQSNSSTGNTSNNNSNSNSSNSSSSSSGGGGTATSSNNSSSSSSSSGGKKK